MGNSLDHMAMCHAKKCAIFFVALPLWFSYFCLIVAVVFCVCVCVWPHKIRLEMDTLANQPVYVVSKRILFLFRILFAKREKKRENVVKSELKRPKMAREKSHKNGIIRSAFLLVFEFIFNSVDLTNRLRFVCIHQDLSCHVHALKLTHMHAHACTRIHMHTRKFNHKGCVCVASFLMLYCHHRVISTFVSFFS